MSVILAVDIVNGKAVKAYAGIRTNYKPLHIKDSRLFKSHQINTKFSRKNKFKKIYIADT